MKKYLLFLLLLFCISCFPACGADETVLYTGDHGGSLSRTIKAIPEKAGPVKIIINEPLNGEEDSYILSLRYRDIESLTIETELPVKNEEILELYAWGIPLTIGAGIELTSCIVYGGGFAQAGDDLYFSRTDVTLNGCVCFAFGGGFAEEGGRCTVGESNIRTGPESLVYYEVFGGGSAHGEGSYAETQTARVRVSGESDYVLGGSFAEAGGHAVSGEADVLVTEEGRVSIALFGGGSAAEDGSLSEITTGVTRLDGTAFWAFGGDFTYNGGKARTNELQMLTIGSTGKCESVFMGGFASGPGAEVFADTSELHIEEGGIAEDKTVGCISSDGGECITVHTADFSQSAL